MKLKGLAHEGKETKGKLIKLVKLDTYQQKHENQIYKKIIKTGAIQRNFSNYQNKFKEAAEIKIRKADCKICEPKWGRHATAGQRIICRTCGKKGNFRKRDK